MVSLVAQIIELRGMTSLGKKETETGLTLIELIVVMLILGVLSSIVLPSVFYNIGKAKETEVKNAVGTINRAQTAFYFERKRFAEGVTDDDTIRMLGLSIKSSYISSFSITTNGNSATVAPSNNNWQADLTRAYSGGVFVVNSGFESIICRSLGPSLQISPPLSSNDCNGNVEVR